MFTGESRLLLGFAALSFLAGAVYLAVTGDRMGAVLFLAALLGSAVLAALFVGRPVADTVSVAGPVSIEEAPASRVRPSVWPAALGVAASLFLVGIVVDTPMIAFAVLAAALAGGGWLLDVWQAHADHNQPGALAAQERVLRPAGLPVLAILGIGLLVVSVSRVLLAVPEQASTAVALVGALAILLVAVLIAARPRLSGATVGTGLGVLALAVVVGGVVAAASGQRSVEAEPTGRVSLAARGVLYTRTRLTVSTQRSVVIGFTNDDADQIHNITIFTAAKPRTQLFFGDPIRGVGFRSYVFDPPGSGRYFYRCEFHKKQMNGTLVVREVPDAKKARG